jgi:hypothetical protein
MTIRDSKYYYDVVMLPAWWFITTFFVNSLALNLFSVIVPGDWLKTDSVYYTWDVRRPLAPDEALSLMIQVPVYKESFVDTIRPTLENAMAACERYMEDTSGAVARIFVNDDGLATMAADSGERSLREIFYTSSTNMLGHSSRPAVGRRGKFKKAGNLNYGLRAILTAGKPAADIILLLDSDSRISPESISYVMREFAADARLGFVQVKTKSMAGAGAGPWVSLVSHFTDNIYSLSFPLVTACGDPSPFVGHNAFIRMKALLDVAETSDSYFSEEHVSEDFEFSMRLQMGGWTGRYVCFGAATNLEYEEGVTLNVFDEVIRLEKYAYGVNEIIFNPVREWRRRGIFGATFKRYMQSDEVSTITKYNILGYMGTYYALALSPAAVIVHYLGFFMCPYWAALTVTGENILYGCALVFAVLTPIATILLKWKMGLQVKVLKECAFTVVYSLFFCGISFQLLRAIMGHALGWPAMNWGATAKEGTSRKTVLVNGLRVMYPSIILSLIELGIILFGWKYMGWVNWRGIVPLAFSAGGSLSVYLMGLL